MTTEEESVFEYLQRILPEVPGQPLSSELLEERRKAAREYKILHPNAPSRPPVPPHEPATTNERGHTASRGRKGRRN